MPYYVISCHIMCPWTFPTRFQKSREGSGVRVKYVFLGLWRQLCCQADGKNSYSFVLKLVNLFTWWNMMEHDSPSRRWGGWDWWMEGLMDGRMASVGTRVDTTEDRTNCVNNTAVSSSSTFCYQKWQLISNQADKSTGKYCAKKPQKCNYNDPIWQL
jgi:hypothetical protein